MQVRQKLHGFEGPPNSNMQQDPQWLVTGSQPHQVFHQPSTINHSTRRRAEKFGLLHCVINLASRTSMCFHGLPKLAASIICICFAVCLSLAHACLLQQGKKNTRRTPLSDNKKGAMYPGIRAVNVSINSFN